jgi:hypothetical protein
MSATAALVGSIPDSDRGRKENPRLLGVVFGGHPSGSIAAIPPACRITILSQPLVYAEIGWRFGKRRRTCGRIVGITGQSLPTLRLC